MQLLRNYWCVAGLLLQRELLVIVASWKPIVGSALVYAAMLALSAGYFMPQMGMSLSCALPLYVGAFVITCISLGYNCAVEVGYDLRSPKLAFYHYTLPVPLWVIIAAKAGGLMMRMLLVSIPTLFLGFVMIGQWQYLSISWIGLTLMLVLSIQLQALTYLILAHVCSLPVLTGNIWPRFLSPVIAFGCTMYPLQSVVEKSWWLSRVLLLNPLTYCCDGLRAALFGGTEYLSFYICIPMLIIFNSMLWIGLWYAVVRAVNPVVAQRV